MPNIHPVHFSIRAAGGARKPNKMDRVSIGDADTHDAATNLALDIFTSVVNTGNTFQDAILAVYLSGLSHGSELQKEKQEG